MSAPSQGTPANALAFVWGLAEATVFFIVPDVWLTFVALRGVRRAFVAAAWAVLGALAGGAVMLWLGARAPEAASRLVDAVPAISPALVRHVHAQVDAQGLLAVLLGPIGGIPYKIYAVDWGARHGGWLAFLLVSVPARGVRFYLLPVLVDAIRRWIVPLTRGRLAVEAAIVAVGWLAFYAFYFVHFEG